MPHGSRQLHPDTLATGRVALRSDPAGLDPRTIARAMAAWVAAIGNEDPKGEARALSQAEAARLLGGSRWSIRRLVAEKKLTPRRLLDGLVRFDRREVEALLTGGGAR